MNSLNVIMAGILSLQGETQDRTGQENPKQDARILEERSNETVTWKNENGKVTLTVRSEDATTGKHEERTYTADTLQTFMEKYPDVAKKYQVDQRGLGLQDPADFKKMLDDVMKRSGIPAGDLSKFFEKFHAQDAESFKDFESLFELERGLFQDLEKKAPGQSLLPPEEAPQAEAPRLGVRIAPVPPAQGAKLGLASGDGLVIVEVERGSAAEQSGFKPQDVLVALKKMPIRDAQEFKKELQTCLKSRPFDLEIIRDGHRMSLSVQPARS